MFSSVHLLAFKNTISDGMKSLVESQQWTSVVDYVNMARAFVRSVASHNNFISLIFSFLEMCGENQLEEQ